jgi:dienelactone hydrolase
MGAMTPAPQVQSDPERPTTGSRLAASGGVLPRLVVGLVIALFGMLAVGGWLSASSWCWPLWFVVGMIAGAAAGSVRHIWLVGLAALAFYPISAWLGLPAFTVTRLHWIVLTIVGAALVASGYALGTLVWWRPRGSARAGGAPRARDAGGRLLIGAVVFGLLGVGTWSGYSGVVGAEEMVNPTGKWPHCETPASKYGWDYEAINYDKADDVRMAAADPDLRDCVTQGTTAGSDVVTIDGISIAGWYIPAASDTGPRGPTLLLVPGWKSNKSEILKYAPPLHTAFNLLLIDLRNGGRSGATLTTWGFRESLDVRAMVDWLVRTKDPSWIGGVGNSMGAATLLAEAVGDPRLKALILDSMHASVAATLGDGIEFEQHLPGYPTAWAMVATTSVRIGADLTSIDPVRTITQLGDRPVLLLHGTADMLDRPERSAERTVAAARQAGVPVLLQYCEGATHGAVIDRCPEQWASWVDDFLRPLATR